MIWVVDKIVAPCLLRHDSRLVEIPMRISFEFAVEAGAVVDGSISIKVLYNAGLVRHHFPTIIEESVAVEIRNTVCSAVTEHLALSGISSKPASRQSIDIEALDTYFTQQEPT